MTIAYRHLREPLGHLRECAKNCARGCPVYDFHTALNEPVLAAERELAKAEEDRMRALAAQARG